MSEQQSPLTYEGMLEIFRQTDLRMAAMHAEADRQIQELKRMFQETDRRFQETDRKFQETDRKFQETDRLMKMSEKKISALGSRIGEMIEHMVSGKGRIVNKFRALGYDINRYGRNLWFENKEQGISGEIDIFLEDGDAAILIEVKTTLETADVRRHIERLEKYRQYADAKGDKRHFIGAVAGTVVTDEVINFTQENGLYAIVPSGKSFEILPMPEGVNVKEW